MSKTYDTWLVCPAGAKLWIKSYPRGRVWKARKQLYTSCNRKSDIVVVDGCYELHDGQEAVDGYRQSWPIEDCKWFVGEWADAKASVSNER